MPIIYVCFTIYVLSALSSADVTQRVQSPRWKMRCNESGFRPPLCTYRLNWARRTSWGWRNNEMTLSSRHRIRNWSPGGLRPSTLPLGHGGSPQYWLSHVDVEKKRCFFQTAETGNRTPNSGVKGSGANHYPRAPAPEMKNEIWRHLNSERSQDPSFFIVNDKSFWLIIYVATPSTRKPFISSPWVCSSSRGTSAFYQMNSCRITL